MQLMSSVTDSRVLHEVSGQLDEIHDGVWLGHSVDVSWNTYR